MKMKQVHSHASSRIVKRYGILPKDAHQFANDKFRECTFLDIQEDGRKRFVHPTEPIFMVTCSEEKVIITVIDKTPEFVSVKTTFLDGMLATLNREYEKMKKSYRKQSREIEAQIAEATVELGTTLVKRARVYNPATQTILQSQADELQAKIGDMHDEMAELKRQYELSSLKVRGFLRTASGNPR